MDQTRNIPHPDDSRADCKSILYNALPTVRTTLTTHEIGEHLERANKRGKLPEVHWEADDRFTIVIPARPIVCHLSGTITSSNSNDQPTAKSSSEATDNVSNLSIDNRIEFEISLDRKSHFWLIILCFASAVPGTWLTDLFLPSWRAWWWCFPLGIISMLWVWFAWPRKSLLDGMQLAPDWIEIIRSRIKPSDRI